MVDWKSHITVAPDTMVRKPIIRDTRISVDLLVDRLTDGSTHEQILSAYPRITWDDILATIAFVTEVRGDHAA